MTNGEMIQKVFTCEVCQPIPEDDIIHVIFSDKNNSAIGFDLSWWNMEYKEPKTGHWITKDGKEQGYDIGGVKTWYIQIMCDKCGFINTSIEGHSGQYKYCPNCGAKMVEPQKSEGEE